MYKAPVAAVVAVVVVPDTLVSDPTEKHVPASSVPAV
jgi:hypothetical protein